MVRSLASALRHGRGISGDPRSPHFAARRHPWRAWSAGQGVQRPWLADDTSIKASARRSAGRRLARRVARRVPVAARRWAGIGSRRCVPPRSRTRTERKIDASERGSDVWEARRRGEGWHRVAGGRALRRTLHVRCGESWPGDQGRLPTASRALSTWGFAAQVAGSVTSPARGMRSPSAARAIASAGLGRSTSSPRRCARRVRGPRLRADHRGGVAMSPMEPKTATLHGRPVSYVAGGRRAGAAPDPRDGGHVRELAGGDRAAGARPHGRRTRPARARRFGSRAPATTRSGRSPSACATCSSRSATNARRLSGTRSAAGSRCSSPTSSPR